MSIAGISPANNLPPGCWGPPEGNEGSERADLRRMLATLKRLPDVVVHLDESLSVAREVIDVTLELQLDPNTPHLDFFDQLTQILERLIATRGVVLRRRQMEAVERLKRRAKSGERSVISDQ